MASTRRWVSGVSFDNRSNGEHFYTTIAGERDQISHTGWTYEGIAFYFYNGANGVPVTRLYNS